MYLNLASSDAEFVSYAPEIPPSDLRIVAKHFVSGRLCVLRLDSVGATLGATERFFGVRMKVEKVFVSS